MHEQHTVEQQLLAEKKILEKKAVRLLEEKEREFAQMKESARQDQEMAVNEALKLRESEFLEKMHAHITSARAEAAQAIA